MADKLRIGILFGGRSGEHDISLMSARSVARAMNIDKYEVSLIGISKEGRWIGGEDPMQALSSGEEGPEAVLLATPHRKMLMQLSSSSESGRFNLEDVGQLDVVFPVLHGTFGEDGSIQGLFELADIAYVGSGVVGSAACMDKAIFKAIMVSGGVPVLPFMLINRSSLEVDADCVLARVEARLSYPVFVKPANLGSSVGISKANDADELLLGLFEASRWDRRIVVEQGINAREIEVSVLGNDYPQVSLAGEVQPRREFYDYVAKYVSRDTELVIPAEISDDQMAKVQELANAAFKMVDCSGMARADFLLDQESGDLWLNELNTIPGFTDISMYAKLWEASGVSYPDLIDNLIELALERKADRDKTVRNYDQ